MNRQCMMSSGEHSYPVTHIISLITYSLILELMNSALLNFWYAIIITNV